MSAIRSVAEAMLSFASDSKPADPAGVLCCPQPASKTANNIDSRAAVATHFFQFILMSFLQIE